MLKFKSIFTRHKFHKNEFTFSMSTSTHSQVAHPMAFSVNPSIYHIQLCIPKISASLSFHKVVPVTLPVVSSFLPAAPVFVLAEVEGVQEFPALLSNFLVSAGVAILLLMVNVISQIFVG